MKRLHSDITNFKFKCLIIIVIYVKYLIFHVVSFKNDFILVYCYTYGYMHVLMYLSTYKQACFVLKSEHENSQMSTCIYEMIFCDILYVSLLYVILVTSVYGFR